MKKLVFIISFITFAGFAFSQDFSAKDQKNLKKVTKFYEKGKYDKSLEYLYLVIDNHNFNNQLWDMAVSISKRKYDVLKQIEMDYFYNEILKKSMEDGGTNIITVEGIDVGAEDARSEYLQACYYGTLKSRSELASMHIRLAFIDKDVDTAVKKLAEEFYDEAEDHFINGDYDESIEDFEAAIRLEPDYYMATLSLGDAYYMKQDYKEAIRYFQKAIDLQPDMLQPRKYITDAYYKAGAFEKALEECINGILIYPDAAMFYKLGDIARSLDYDYENVWLPRLIVPNMMDTEQSAENEVFQVYRLAKEKIEPYCDSNGVIIKTNPYTKEKYLEVFSWQEMTEEYPDVEYFETSIEMNEKGYLDCYLFISLFHISMYDQFKHFIENNRDKAITYIKKYYLSD